MSNVYTIVYFSLTGQTRRFVEKAKNCDNRVELREIKRWEDPIHVSHPYILAIPTYVRGVLQGVDDFLQVADHAALCRGIYCSGNRNFAELFCFSGVDISQDYQIPLLHKFEFQGSDHDVDQLLEDLYRLC